MLNPMDGCWAKIERADEHIRYLATEIQRFADSNVDRYRVFTEIDRESGLCVVKAVDQGLDAPPLRLSVIIGEILHHMRSSLDHLVWALVSRKNANASFRVSFPICESVAQYDKAVRDGIIKGVPGRARALIDSVQPYREKKPRNSALFALHELNRTEKHRLLIVAFGVVAAPNKIDVDPGKSDIVFQFPEAASVVRLTRPTKDGAEFFRYTLNRIDETVKVNLNIPCHVVLEDLGSGKLEPVIPRLTHLRDATAKTLELFKGEF